MCSQQKRLLRNECTRRSMANDGIWLRIGWGHFCRALHARGQAVSPSFVQPMNSSASIYWYHPVARTILHSMEIQNVIDASAFNPVPGTNDAWMYAQLDLGNQVPILAPTRIENSANVFHLGIIHGGASSGTRFGYFSDYGALKYQAVNQTVNACLESRLLCK